MRVLAVGVERDDGLQHDVRIQPAVGEAEPALPYLLVEQPPERLLADEIARGVVTDGVRREQIREVVPHAELGVLAVRVLETFDRANGFRLADARLEPVETLGQRAESRGALRARVGTREREHRRR